MPALQKGGTLPTNVNWLSSSPRAPLRVTSRLPDCVSATAGAPQIAADLQRHQILAALGHNRSWGHQACCASSKAPTVQTWASEQASPGRERQASDQRHCGIRRFRTGPQYTAFHRDEGWQLQLVGVSRVAPCGQPRYLASPTPPMPTRQENRPGCATHSAVAAHQSLHRGEPTRERAASVRDGMPDKR